MRVLLPPSEGKSIGGRGRAIGPGPLPGPLGATRTDVLDALAKLMARDADTATAALLLPAGVAAEALAANRIVRDSPTTPALRRYTGVVYEALDPAGLPATARRIAGRDTLIFSGLWGVVRGDEPVPAYRVPAKATLPGIGVVAGYWRRVLDEVMPRLLGRGPVIDLRSSDYAAMWRPRGAVAERLISVRVLSPLPRGGHGVISYNSKHAKGLLAGALFRRVADGSSVEGPEDVVAAWSQCGGASGEVTGPGAVVLHTGTGL